MSWVDGLPGVLAEAWPTLALLAILTIVARRAWPQIRAFVRRSDAIDRIPQIEKTLEEFKPLLAELATDSERSIKDRITRIDVRVGNVESRTIRLDERLHAIEQNTQQRPPH